MKELNDFIRQLEQAQKAIARLDGPLTQIQFDPDQPGSINAAIGKMEAEIDRILAPYRNNPFVAELDIVAPFEMKGAEPATSMRSCWAGTRAPFNRRENTP